MYYSLGVTSTVSLVLSLIISTAAAPPKIAGYTLAWSDDFTGSKGTLPDPSKWMLRSGTSNPGGEPKWGTGEIQTYTTTSANVRLSGGGHLEIIPIRDSKGAWTSGRIETKQTNFQAQPGKKMRIQASLRLPQVTTSNGLGYWPAFWTLGGAFRGNYTNWPAVGEFDIMENVNGINQGWDGIHCDKAPGGICNEPSGLSTTLSCTGSSCQADYHTYALEVDRSVTPEVLRLSIDGRVGRQVSANDVGTAVWNQIAHHGHFIILNVAVGGAFCDAVAGTKTPTTATLPGMPLFVDYVAVYYS